MRDEIEEVLLYQPDWTSKNSPEMQRRGVLIRHEIADQLKGLAAELQSSAGDQLADLAVQGRDATGPKAEIPWTRFYSASRSPRATVGWYVVYLFDAMGGAAYLSLNQGTTTWTGDAFVSKDLDELGDRVAWARGVLSDEIAGDPRLELKISLNARKSHLGPQYEAGNVVAYAYELDSVPDDSQLRDDARRMAELLGKIYLASDNAAVPGETPPEILDIIEAAEEAAGDQRGKPRGQGFRLSSDEKLIIEKYSVRMASDFYKAQGWAVDDVGASLSYDLHLERGEEVIHVEVKGTTSPGEQVVVTRKEVEHQRDVYPLNALVVVHGIVLDRSGETPTASGGELVETAPWDIVGDDLKVISYFYRTGL